MSRFVSAWTSIDMAAFNWLLVLGLAAAALGEELRKFPDGFLFGSATASYQIEGAWNFSDKSENIWDRFTHIANGIADGSTGDVADDSYHLFRRDVEILRELGLDFYRFSISWSRLLPSGFPDTISEDGKRYYNELIDELLAHNIKPFITIYHWDLPQQLQDLGGWANPLMAQWFEDYARVVFDLFADRVQLWVTLNEPGSFCIQGYAFQNHAPALGQPGRAEYLCARNAVLAHARAWRLFDQEYRPKYGGKCGLTNNMIWFVGATDSEEDQTVAELSNQLLHGMFVHAVYSPEGGWPKNIEKVIAENSAKEGYPRSRLPDFTQEEIDYIKGTYDYFGFQYYLSRLARRSATPDGGSLIYAAEVGAEVYSDPAWETGAAGLFSVYPIGMRKALNFVKERYNNPQILITENGYASTAGIADESRVRYHREHLDQVLDAIYQDGCNITHYTAWSLMDNFEWAFGYTVRFGLYEVDYSSPERTRTPRKSAAVYKEIVRTRTIDPHYEPKSLNISIS